MPIVSYGPRVKVTPPPTGPNRVKYFVAFFVDYGYFITNGTIVRKLGFKGSYNKSRYT